ncbi:MAG TPA: AsmA family protein, partial [Chryseosolibacter sp.]
MKLIRRVLFYLTLLTGAAVIALAISAVLFKDRIIKEFIREANKQINTPITIKKMDVSLLDEFPRLSIVFRDVYVEDSQPGHYPLLTAAKISFQLNPMEVWNGSYTVKGMEVEGCEANLKIDEAGVNNYTIIKKQSAAGGQSTIGFELSDVSLRGTTVHYIDLRMLQDFTFKSEKVLASIHSLNDVYNIDAEGQLTAEKLTIGENNYLNQKSFDIKSHLVYDDLKKNLTIHPSDLGLKTSAFSVTGTYRWKDKNIIDLTTTGKNTDLQTLLSLLPESKARNFEKYRSRGDVYFKARLNGEISSSVSPALTVDFGFKDATLYHPDYKTKIENANLTGSFHSRDVSDLTKAVLVLKAVNGKLNDEDFHANFALQDFTDPEVVLDFKGKIDARSLLDFYPVSSFKYVSGAVVVDIAFDGKINLLKHRSTAQRVSTLGTVDMEHINLLYGDEHIPL